MEVPPPLAPPFFSLFPVSVLRRCNVSGFFLKAYSSPSIDAYLDFPPRFFPPELYFPSPFLNTSHLLSLSRWRWFFSSEWKLPSFPRPPSPKIFFWKTPHSSLPLGRQTVTPSQNPLPRFPSYGPPSDFSPSDFINRFNTTHNFLNCEDGLPPLNGFLFYSKDIPFSWRPFPRNPFPL